eukprot:SAG25_NODE_148_length_13769_cov_14.642648_9_plen_146_part_00
MSALTKMLADFEAGAAFVAGCVAMLPLCAALSARALSPACQRQRHRSLELPACLWRVGGRPSLTPAGISRHRPGHPPRATVCGCCGSAHVAGAGRRGRRCGRGSRQPRWRRGWWPAGGREEEEEEEVVVAMVIELLAPWWLTRLR